MEPPAPSVAVVVLNWNNYVETAHCLNSIRRGAPSSSLRIWVVDNGSEDGSGERLQRQQRALAPPHALAAAHLRSNAGWVQGFRV